MFFSYDSIAFTIFSFKSHISILLTFVILIYTLEDLKYHLEGWTKSIPCKSWLGILKYMS